MFFPIGDTNIKHGYKPFVAYALIAVNILVYVMEFLMPPPLQQQYIYHYGAIPVEILQSKDMYTLFTNMFLHGSWTHLIGNMMFLWVFGDNIEATVGYIKFFIFYVLGGVVATLTHIFFNVGSVAPTIGASGAIAACLGAYLVMFPTSKIKVFVLFLLSSFNVPAILFLGFWIIQQFTNGVGAIQSRSLTDNVAYWAHIGGFVYGILAGFLFRKEAVRLTQLDARNTSSAS